MIIKTKNLNLIYGSGDTSVHALKNINLEVKKGDLLALKGPSGSGKSSLLHVIGAMQTPTSGEVIINGKAIQNYNRYELSKIRRDEIGFIFQSFALIRHLTAIENVMIPLYPQNPENLKEKAEKMLSLVGLENRMYHKPSQLSGGENQRVAIARALINHPNIILGDEITGNLDSTTGNDIFNIIEELNKSQKITIILVTHDNELANKCHYSISMKDGNLLINN